MLWENQLKAKSNAIERAPGGNERNLQFWLLENTNTEDLILNDLTQASHWYVGFRAQNLINVNTIHKQLSLSFNKEAFTWEPKQPGLIATLKSNKILQHPWDHEMIEETIREFDIKYVYLTDRRRSPDPCTFEKYLCYVSDNNWPWFDYSGDARIAMYENHPNLELVLRNGNSAIFKVVE